MVKPETGKSLDRYLSRLDVWAMSFGCMVGWGAFVMPGTTFLPMAGPVGTVIAMGLGVGIMLMLSACLSYLMMRSPRTGGIYSYTKEAFGRDHAFLCTWFLCLSYLTIVFLNGSALFLVIRTAFGQSLQTAYYTVAGNRIYLGEVSVSVCALAGLALLFIIAKPVLQKLHTVLSVVLAMGTIITAAACLPDVLSTDVVRSFGTQGVGRPYAVFSLMILAPWAFAGFEVISFDTAHFRFPARKAGGIAAASILMAGAVYIGMALVSVSAVPDGYAGWAEYFGDLDSLSGFLSVPTFYAAEQKMGMAGLAVLTVTAMAAILTGIIGAYRAALRVLSTMAEDRILSEKFSNTTFSILFVMVLSILLSLLGRNTLIWFVDLTSFGATVAYGYTAAAAFKIAKTENNRRITAVAAVSMVIAGAFAIVQLVPHLTALDTMGREAFLLLSVWCLLGFLFYWQTVIRSTLTEYSGISASGTVLFAMLLYSALMWLAKVLASQESVEAVRSSLMSGGIVLLLIVFVGLTVMQYIQDLVREKHEASEREKIRATESSLAKSQFLFNMSHDIRTPMNAVIGYTELALREKTDPAVHDYLTKIRSSGMHLLELINDVLEMSRIESGIVELKYTPIDLIGLFEEQHALFEERMLEKKLDFSVHTPQVCDRFVWCDRKNLGRILQNLLSNAWKFTPEGGAVLLSLWETGSTVAGYGSYEIRVQDSGIGMSKKFVEKMFTAFERERTSTASGIEGTGLGLTITKSLTDLIGGTIEVLTSPGSGTEMIIRLKLRLAEEEDVRKEQQRQNHVPQEEFDFSGKKVLLVEDNVVNREIALMILEQQGFEVETAEDGREALNMVSASTPGTYDAILMDIQMPVMDGYEAARAIRRLENPELAQIPILAMTANAFPEDVRAALDAGMQAHIAKPVDIVQLMRELKKVLD